MPFRNSPQDDTVKIQNPPSTLAAPADVDTMQARRFGHAVAVELADAKLQVDSGSHRSTARPAPYASERSAPEPEHAP